MKNSPSRGVDLPPIDFDDTDFPGLPARVPPGEYLEGPIAAAQWQFWNTPQEERERVTQILTQEAFIRSWAPTEPLGLDQLFLPTQPQTN